MPKMSNKTIANNSTTWLSVAFNAVQQSPHLHDDLYDILRAFGADDNDAPGPANLDPDDLDSATNDTVDSISYLKNRIATELLDEIDSDQASMFSRRFVSVSTLLKHNSNGDNRVTGKQLLRLALHRRTVQILSTTDPILSSRKALRIRALVDFIWSLALVLSLKESPDNDQHPTLAQLAQEQGQQCSSNEFSPGFYHSTIEGITSDFGPVHINVLRINLTTSNCRIKCVDSRDICTDLPTLAKQMNAVAAISGGFFLYSEPDIEIPSKRTDPVGLLVTDGEIVAPPVFQRSAIVQLKNGEAGSSAIALDKIGMHGVCCILNCSWEADNKQFGCTLKFQLKIGASEEYDANKDLVHAQCIHRGISEEAIIERGQCAFAIVGNTVVNHMNPPDIAAKIAVPLAGFVLVFSKEALHYPWDAAFKQNDAKIEISYELPTQRCIDNAIAGGPMFFSDDDNCNVMDLPSEDFKGSAPPVTFSQDETHDHNLLPRMGVGMAKCPESGNELLVCVAVDGRNLDRALGLTLQGTSDLLRSLGCYKAMNLDGGSSKRMVIWDVESMEHKVVCLSTTEIKTNNGNGNSESKEAAVEPSRPVHSAILFCSASFNSQKNQRTS